MGFNISGVAISKNYQEDFESLKKQYGWNLEGPVEVSFETASANWTEDDVCNVYYTENGTLIFLSMERAYDGMPLDDANTMSFCYSEMSMTFALNYYEGKVSKRTILETEGDRKDEDGDPLSVEAEGVSTDAALMDQMEILLGKNFFQIDPSEKAYQYKFVRGNRTETLAPPKADPLGPTKVPDEKVWWEFWK
jgi:hypothetical protein